MNIWKKTKIPRPEKLRDGEVLAKKQKESLTKEGSEVRQKEAGNNEDIKHNRDVAENMTKVPLGPTCNTKN